MLADLHQADKWLVFWSLLLLLHFKCYSEKNRKVNTQYELVLKSSTAKQELFMCALQAYLTEPNFPIAKCSFTMLFVWPNHINLSCYSLAVWRHNINTNHLVFFPSFVHRQRFCFESHWWDEGRGGRRQDFGEVWRPTFSNLRVWREQGHRCPCWRVVVLRCRASISCPAHNSGSWGVSPGQARRRWYWNSTRPWKWDLDPLWTLPFW